MLAQAPDAQGSRGAVVLITSVLATDPVPELFATHAYAASKGAVNALMTTDGGVLRPAPDPGQRPGPGPDGYADGRSRGGGPSHGRLCAAASSRSPMASWTRSMWPSAALFLLSDEAARITGQLLAVDGGWSVTAVEAGGQVAGAAAFMADPAKQDA